MTEQMRMDYLTPTHPSPLEGEGKGEGAQDAFTREEQHVLSLLQRGRENALSVPYLASMVGLSGVQLRATVRHLITHHGYCIGSSTGGTNKPPGNYIPRKQDEIFDSP